MQPSLIDMQRVSVMRGSRVVLHDFTLRVAAGEHVAILGPNGCGKSTLIKCITRELYPLYDPQSSFTIFGRDTWNIFDLRPLLGIVTNDLMLLATRNVTGRHLILGGYFSSIEIMPWHDVTDEMREHTAEVLDALEITRLADRPLIELSSGEARRMLIARALVHHPRALLFDEPSNSLDVFAQKELRQVMRKLAQSGIAVLLVTHHLADVIPEIQRVILMQDGTIVGDGPKEEMLTRQRLAEVFRMKVELTTRDGYYHLW